MSLKQCSLSLVINHMVNATWPVILENMLQGNQPYCHVAMCTIWRAVISINMCFGPILLVFAYGSTVTFTVAAYYFGLVGTGETVRSKMHIWKLQKSLYT